MTVHLTVPSEGIVYSGCLDALTDARRHCRTKADWKEVAKAKNVARLMLLDDDIDVLTAERILVIAERRGAELAAADMHLLRLVPDTSRPRRRVIRAVTATLLGKGFERGEIGRLTEDALASKPANSNDGDRVCRTRRQGSTSRDLGPRLVPRTLRFVTGH